MVIVGRYNVGKSTLINSLFFKTGEKCIQRAEEGLLEPTTRNVAPHRHDISHNIYDSPGLQDGNEEDIVYILAQDKGEMSQDPPRHLLYKDGRTDMVR